MATCSNPGCDQPGTNHCSACKSALYCGSVCQTADWPHHKEECQGHLRKVGEANLVKAIGFDREQNWAQSLRYGEIAASKLKQLKNRRLETVQAIDEAMRCKLNALQFLGRHREAMECAEEKYTLWAMNHLRNPGSMRAAFGLIQSCLHNKKFEDAETYARHAYFMIAEMTDNFIPSDEYPQFLADVSYYLALAIFRLTTTGGTPPEGKQKAGEEAIKFAREALALYTQLHGTESANFALSAGVLAEVLSYFNDVDDAEVFHLLEQSGNIVRRLEGNLSVNVATIEGKMGRAYIDRANRAALVNNVGDSRLRNLELSLNHIREELRIFREINHVDSADDAQRFIIAIEEDIRQIRIGRAAAASEKS